MALFPLLNNVMAIRKHKAEIALQAQCVFMTIMQQADFELHGDDHEALRPDFHIYMIARRPRVSFQYDSVRITDTRLTVDIVVNKGEIEETITLNSDHPELEDASLTCEYPGSMLTITPLSTPSTIFSPSYVLNKAGLYADFLNLEVLYVGKSLGKNRRRTAKERLLSHEHLQAIYAKNMRDTPHMDIWLVLCEFDFDLMIYLNPTERYESSLETSADRMMKAATLTLPKHDKISLVEAALINYFKPEYNQHFKDKSPGSRHKSFSSIIEQDLAEIIVDVATTNISTGRLWSSSVLPKDRHVFSFNLRDPLIYKSMFEVDGANILNNK